MKLGSFDVRDDGEHSGVHFVEMSGIAAMQHEFYLAMVQSDRATGSNHWFKLHGFHLLKAGYTSTHLDSCVPLDELQCMHGPTTDW